MINLYLVLAILGTDVKKKVPFGQKLDPAKSSTLEGSNNPYLQQPEPRAAGHCQKLMKLAIKIQQPETKTQS